MIDVDNFRRGVKASLHRVIHVDPTTLLRLTRFPSTEPYWGKNKAYRFDDPKQMFGVTYAARKIEVAFAETVLHESGAFYDNAWMIREAKMRERYVIRYVRPVGDLRVLDLTGMAGKRLGLNNDISAYGDYAVPMAVARVLYEETDLDGICYVSRQCNTDYAYAIFERSGLSAKSGAAPLMAHPHYLDLLDYFNVELLPDTLPPA